MGLALYKSAQKHWIKNVRTKKFTTAGLIKKKQAMKVMSPTVAIKYYLMYEKRNWIS